MPPPARIGLDPAAYARGIEHAGFGSVWIPGVNATADLDALEPLLSATERLVVATGIASVWTWQPAELAARADALAGWYPGRFILGLGVSHAPLVESAGQAYVRPLANGPRVRQVLPGAAELREQPAPVRLRGRRRGGRRQRQADLGDHPVGPRGGAGQRPRAPGRRR